jgi:hypothetical protein
MQAMPFFILIMTVAAVLLSGAPVFAWGPGVHTALCNTLLSHLGLLAPAVAELVAGRADIFRYGCLSADIFIGKGSAYRPGHSHNWATGLRLLESAKSDQLKAFAYGYLTHLAADVVAHNYYVPSMMLKAPKGGVAGHVLVEMQADAHIEWCGIKAGRNFFPRRRDAEAVLLSAVRQTKKTPFRIKKGLYQGGLFLCKAAPKGRSAAFLERLLPINGNAEYLQAMLDTSLSLIVHVLRDPQGSPVLKHDPIGEKALQRAMGMQRQKLFVEEKGPRFPVEAGLLRLPGCGVAFPYLKGTMPSAA